MKNGLEFPSVLLVYSPGNNVGNSYFIWKVQDTSVEEAFKNSQPLIEEVMKSLPVYHSRAMHSEFISKFISKFGLVSPSVKPAILRYFYRDLTCDSSSSSSLSECEVDEHVKETVEMEDPDILWDLRQLNSGKRSQYDDFWDECEKFLQEDVGTAVDDCRHTEVTHIAKAISVRDFRDQVAARCADDVCIRSKC